MLYPPVPHSSRHATLPTGGGCGATMRVSEHKLLCENRQDKLYNVGDGDDNGATNEERKAAQLSNDGNEGDGPDFETRFRERPRATRQE